MANGQTHQTINVAALVGAAGLVAIAVNEGWGDPWTSRVGFEWPAVAVFIGAFLVGTYLVTPDLDLAEQGVLAKRNWGWLGVIWVPYGYLFAHRGVSHGWFLGPLTRLAYLAALIVLVAGAAYYGAEAGGLEVPPIPRVDARMWRPAWLWWVAAGVGGFYVSQWIHLLADGVGPLHGLRRLVGKLAGR